MPDDDRLLFLISQTQHILKNYLKNEFRSSGVRISPAQMGVLFLLKLRNARSMSELGREIGVDNSAITGFVDRLEKSGFVERRSDPADRRAYLIHITEDGVREINIAKKIVVRTNALLKEGFTADEIAIFRNVLFSFYSKFGDIAAAKEDCHE